MPMIRSPSEIETKWPEIEAREDIHFENEIYQKLVEAQVEARSTPVRLSHTEVFDPLRQKIAAAEIKRQ